MSTKVLIHHGIKGQKWGIKNGPPYPLDFEDHSASEKKHKSKWTKRSEKIENKRLASNRALEYQRESINKMWDEFDAKGQSPNKYSVADNRKWDNKDIDDAINVNDQKYYRKQRVNAIRANMSGGQRFANFMLGGLLGNESVARLQEAGLSRGQAQVLTFIESPYGGIVTAGIINTAKRIRL